jgi:hypothetical protein
MLKVRLTNKSKEETIHEKQRVKKKKKHENGSDVTISTEMRQCNTTDNDKEERYNIPSYLMGYALLD